MLRVLVVPDKKLASNAKVDDGMAARHLGEDTVKFFRFRHLLDNDIGNEDLTGWHEGQWLIYSLKNARLVDQIVQIIILGVAHMNLHLFVDSLVGCPELLL